MCLFFFFFPLFNFFFFFNLSSVFIYYESHPGDLPGVGWGGEGGVRAVVSPLRVAGSEPVSQVSSSLPGGAAPSSGGSRRAPGWRLVTVAEAGSAAPRNAPPPSPVPSPARLTWSARRGCRPAPPPEPRRQRGAAIRSGAAAGVWGAEGGPAHA